MQSALPSQLAEAWYLHQHWGFPLDGIDFLFGLVTCSGGFVFREQVALLSERHTELSVDDSGRLHSEHGPAIAWPDGFAIYAWHGVRVPRYVIDHPDLLSPGSIWAEENAEVRRVMIERIGYENLIAESDAQAVATDDAGTLWRIDVQDDEALVVVEVANATLEPDRSRRRYFLRVPPWIGTPIAAVAWTFGLLPREYAPTIET